MRGAVRLFGRMYERAPADAGFLRGPGTAGVSGQDAGVGDLHGGVGPVEGRQAGMHPARHVAFQLVAVDRGDQAATMLPRTVTKAYVFGMVIVTSYHSYDDHHYTSPEPDPQARNGRGRRPDGGGDNRERLRRSAGPFRLTRYIRILFHIPVTAPGKGGRSTEFHAF